MSCIWVANIEQLVPEECGTLLGRGLKETKNVLLVLNIEINHPNLYLLSLLNENTIRFTAS